MSQKKIESTGFANGSSMCDVRKPGGKFDSELDTSYGSDKKQFLKYSPSPKTSEEIELLKKETEDGVKVLCLNTVPIESIPESQEQKLVKTSDGLSVILAESIFQAPFVLNSKIRDYIETLECLDRNVQYENFEIVFKGLLEKVRKLLPFKHEFITNNKGSFIYRLFGAGSPPFSKVREQSIREQLLATLNEDDHDYYPDESSSNTYKYSMLFYCQYEYPLPQLNNPDFELNLEVISYLVDELLPRVITNKNLQSEDPTQHIFVKSYLGELVNILMENPQTSDLIQIKRFRNLASTKSKAIAFHFQLVREQMITSKKWKGDIPVWTLEQDTDGLEDNIGHFEDLWMLHQLPVTKQKQYFVFDFKHNIPCKIPSLAEAERRFDNFTWGILSERRNNFVSEFYGNLLISGSIISYIASILIGREQDNLDDYSHSDIDCPILAGDGVFMSNQDLKEVAEQKKKLLEDCFPSGYHFELVSKDSRWLIRSTKFTKITLELYCIPFSLDTVAAHFANYHLGQVRGYLRFVPSNDGIAKLELKLLPSSIPALLLRTSLDIRYCSSKRPPQEIILKNEKRLFSVIKNRRETESHFKYSINVLPNVNSRYDLSIFHNSIYSSYRRLINLLPPSQNSILGFKYSYYRLHDENWCGIPVEKRLEFNFYTLLTVTALSKCRRFVMNDDGLWAPLISTDY